jgi:hypothetical protein
MGIYRYTNSDKVLEDILRAPVADMGIALESLHTALLDAYRHMWERTGDHHEAENVIKYVMVKCGVELDLAKDFMSIRNPAPINGDTVILFGKYANKSINEIISINPQYLQWAIRSSVIPDFSDDIKPYYLQKLKEYKESRSLIRGVERDALNDEIHATIQHEK